MDVHALNYSDTSENIFGAFEAQGEKETDNRRIS
jgi:hypothetical protein